MADFCQDHVAEVFGRELTDDGRDNDMRGLCEPGQVAWVLCEGIGVEVVDHLGTPVADGSVLVDPAATLDADRAQSAAELIERFLTDLEGWLQRPIYNLRWFAEHWLPAGEIPPPATQADLDLVEDMASTSVRAAASHIDALTAREGS